MSTTPDVKEHVTSAFDSFQHVRAIDLSFRWSSVISQFSVSGSAA